MTLDDLATSARATKLGTYSAQVLADDVLTYIDTQKRAIATITPRQAELLAAWKAYQQEHGYPPSLQDMGDALGISKVTVFEMAQALQSKGMLRTNGKKHSKRALYAVEVR